MAKRKFRDIEDDRWQRVEKVRKKKRLAKAHEFDKPFFLPEDEWTSPAGETFSARVVEVHKRYAFVNPEIDGRDIDTRDVRLATVAKKYLPLDRRERNFVAVGDRVLCRAAEAAEVQPSSDLPQCVILHTAPRQTQVARMDPSQPDRQQVLAANIDVLLIMASYLKPKVKWGLIDRYLVLAEAENITPIIVLNKKDLLDEDPDFKAHCQEYTEHYRKLGYEAFSIQANRGRLTADVKRIGERIAGKIALISGHSGVGKSSLLNLFRPEIEQDVEPNEDIFYKGRHTTTYASMIRLGTGGFLIDTPGIRSFCIEERGPVELGNCFPEFREFVGKCKYRECKHIDEPDCVVQEAVAKGVIPEWRYRSFLAILLGATGREGRVRDLEVDE